MNKNNYSVSGNYGQVEFFKVCTPTNNFKSIDHIYNSGWHKVNELYSINRPKGINVGLIIFTIGGTGKVCIDGKTHMVNSGDVIVIPSGVPHSYCCPPNGTWEFYWIHYFGTNASLTASDFIQHNGHVVYIGVDLIKSLLKRINSPHTDSLENEVLESGELRKIFYVLLSKVFSYRQIDTNLINEMKLYLINQDNVNFSLKELEDKYHYSREHIIRKFTNATGISPYQYWLTNKLNESCIDLREGVLSISEISLKYGYNSSSSYSKQFKKQFKISPSDYRNIYN